VARRNAIERRLDELADQWNDFVEDPAARLLRWVVRDDEYRVLEAFVQCEQDEAAGRLPDLFLRFDEPFQDVDRYGAILREALVAGYEAAREEAAEEVDGATRPDGDAGGSDGDDRAARDGRATAPTDGLALTWRPPEPGGGHSLLDFVEACAALHAHHADRVEKVALVLTPETVSDAGEWSRWLHAFAERLPEPVRAAVVDPADAPELAGLAEALPERVRTVVAELDMPAAVAELSRSGGTATPDGRFRTLFAALGQALSAGDLEGARSHADRALAVTGEHGWTHLGAAVHMALAGGYLSAGDHREAVRTYAEADAAGQELEESGEEVGSELRVQAGMGAGAAFLAAGDTASAARAYGATADHAEKAANTLMLLECRRMSAWCHEQLGNVERSWADGLEALAVAEGLPEEERATSTVPFVAEGLLRLAGDSPSHQRLVEERMGELLGADWRSALGSGPDFT
jgi:hypothetical protein